MNTKREKYEKELFESFFVGRLGQLLKDIKISPNSEDLVDINSISESFIKVVFSDLVLAEDAGRTERGIDTSNFNSLRVGVIKNNAL